MTALFDPLVWAALRHETAATEPTLLADLMDEFRAQVAGHVTALPAALLAVNIVPVRDIAHRLKGTAGMLGLPRLALAAKELESAARAGDVAGVQLGFEQLKKVSRETFSDPAVVAISSP